MQSLARELLNKSLTFYLEFAKRQSTDPEIRLGTADAYRRVGLIYHKLNQHRRAEEALAEAIARLEEISPEGPSERVLRLQLAGAYHALGLVLNETKGSQQAEQAHRCAIRILDQSVTDYPEEPEYRLWLATAHNSLGTVLHSRPREAERTHRQAITLCEKLVADFPEKIPYWGELIRSHHTLGLVQANSCRLEEAVKSFRDAIALFTRQAGPLKASYQRRLLPVAHLELAKALHALLRHDEARDRYREAHTLYEQYVADYPRISEYWVRLYDCCANQTRLMEQTGKPVEATEVIRQAFDLYETLVRRLPEEVADQGVPRIATGLDAVLKVSMQPQERERGYRHALQLSEKLAVKSPEVPGNPFHVAYWHNAMGALLTSTGRDSEAAHAYRHVVETTTALLAGKSETQHLASFGMFFLAAAHWHLGHKSEARNWHHQAVEWVEKNQPNNPELCRFRTETAALLSLDEPSTPATKEVPRLPKG
jgi:tetratricopeptide (TPR) repeat protein